MQDVAVVACLKDDVGWSSAVIGTTDMGLESATYLLARLKANWVAEEWEYTMQWYEEINVEAMQQLYW